MKRLNYCIFVRNGFEGWVRVFVSESHYVTDASRRQCVSVFVCVWERER